MNVKLLLNNAQQYKDRMISGTQYPKFIIEIYEKSKK